MPWDDGLQAGFTSGKPWLPLSRDWRQTNVAREQHDPDSLLSLYKRLIRLKKGSQALTAGAYQPVDAGPEDCLLYQRYFQAENITEAMLIAVNFSSQMQSVSIPNTVTIHGRVGTVILSTNPQERTARWNADQFQLEPDEGIVVRLVHQPILLSP